MRLPIVALWSLWVLGFYALTAVAWIAYFWAFIWLRRRTGSL
ncbi:MAG: hypothetical protein ACFB13_20150 [Kiloniellaceae bacterium]